MLPTKLLILWVCPLCPLEMSVMENGNSSVIHRLGLWFLFLIVVKYKYKNKKLSIFNN